MNFKVNGLVTVRIFSKDISKSRNWYKQFFGIDPIEDTDNFVSFKIDDIRLDISLADSKSPSSPGGSVSYWLTDNIDQIVNQTLKLGGIVYRGPLRVNEIQRTIVQIQDPSGNVIGFEAPF